MRGQEGFACLMPSQALDSFAPATRWEFVAEETLKLGAEALLLGGLLVALNGALREDDGRAATTRPPGPRR